MLKEIIEIIKVKGIVSIIEIKDSLKKDRKTIQHAIDLLVQKGLLKRSSINLICDGCNSCKKLGNKRYIISKELSNNVEFIELTGKGLKFLEK
ncbi:MAG: FeoC-like transcriptional regulator [Candidatus Helarchaeota archaeon]